MAEFCKECSIALFGKDHNDLAGTITAEDTAAGYVSSVVICEGCGPIQVDHEGLCKSEDCVGEHRKLTPHAADVEQALDGEEEEEDEDEEDNHCYECCLHLEDCECEPTNCEDCNRLVDDCACRWAE